MPPVFYQSVTSSRHSQSWRSNPCTDREDPLRVPGWPCLPNPSDRLAWVGECARSKLHPSDLVSETGDWHSGNQVSFCSMLKITKDAHLSWVEGLVGKCTRKQKGGERKGGEEKEVWRELQGRCASSETVRVNSPFYGSQFGLLFLNQMISTSGSS